MRFVGRGRPSVSLGVWLKIRWGVAKMVILRTGAQRTFAYVST